MPSTYFFFLRIALTARFVLVYEEMLSEEVLLWAYIKLLLKKSNLYEMRNVVLVLILTNTASTSRCIVFEVNITKSSRITATGM